MDQDGVRHRAKAQPQSLRLEVERPGLRDPAKARREGEVCGLSPTELFAIVVLFILASVFFVLCGVLSHAWGDLPTGLGRGRF